MKIPEILPYDKTSASSIFEYSKGILEKTLREFVWEGYQPKKGKGGLGQMVENIYFFLETNSNPASDFSEAGLELKCTPLKKSKLNDFLIKERLVCNMTNYCKFKHPYAIYALHNLAGTRPLYNNRILANRSSLQFGSFLNHIQANVWSVKCLQDNECTHARCLGHSLMPEASVPS